MIGKKLSIQFKKLTYLQASFSDSRLKKKTGNKKNKILKNKKMLQLKIHCYYMRAKE